jgi:hypothetical protein
VRPPVTLLYEIDFRKGGNSGSFARTGWAEQEDDHTWAMSPASKLLLPPGRPTPFVVVVFQVVPFTYDNVLTEQRIEVFANGRKLLDDLVSCATVLAVAIEHIPADAHIHLRFEFSAAPLPSAVGLKGETRPLTVLFRRAWIFAVDERVTRDHVLHTRVLPASTVAETAKAAERLTSLTGGDLLCRFESLGHSCDFGLVQRELGMEPLGLFRFTGISTHDAFLGLMDRFASIGDRAAIHPRIVEGLNEYWIDELNYGLHYHTFIPPDKATPDQLIAREMSRLPFLSRKLLEDLQLGEKIFLLRRPDPMKLCEAVAIWAAINTYGPNSLLFLEQEGGGEPGTVEQLGPRFMRGHIDGILGQVSPQVPTWLAVCANAYEAIRLSNDR